MFNLMLIFWVAFIVQITLAHELFIIFSKPILTD
jgi:hypothetical protein